jgi:hypothetical protein
MPMTTLLLQAIPNNGLVEPKGIFRSSVDGDTITGTRPAVGRSEPFSTQSTSPRWRLDLSKSRAHDAALDILDTYKLTGNFHINLEIVLKDIGAFDQVTFEVEPKSALSCEPDRRHVVFWANENIHSDRFDEIVSAIKARIGFDAAMPWWGRLFRQLSLRHST